jgi:hypothetical protein
MGLIMSLRGRCSSAQSNLLLAGRLLRRKEQERSSQRHQVTNLYPTPVTVSIFTVEPSNFLRRCAMWTSTVRV